jgi:hypothetical protein
MRYILFLCTAAFKFHPRNPTFDRRQPGRLTSNMVVTAPEVYGHTPSEKLGKELIGERR